MCRTRALPAAVEVFPKTTLMASPPGLVGAANSRPAFIVRWDKEYEPRLNRTVSVPAEFVTPQKSPSGNLSATEEYPLGSGRVVSRKAVSGDLTCL